MLSNNQVRLCGEIFSEDTIERRLTSLGNYYRFRLRVCERRYSKREGKFTNFYEYPQVVVSDKGIFKPIASRYAELLVPGNRLLIEGKLHCYTISDARGNLKRITEVEALAIELLQPQQEEAC